MIKELQKFNGDLQVYFFNPSSDSASWTEDESDLYQINAPFYVGKDGDKIIIEE